MILKDHPKLCVNLQTGVKGEHLIIITDELPALWTYPDIQPYLLEEYRSRKV